MVILDPRNNPFYFCSPKALEIHDQLPGRLQRQFEAAIRPLAMGTTARNPFVYERHDPDADPYRILTLHWQHITIFFRNVPDDPRFEVVDIKANIIPVQPGMFFP